MASSNEAIRVVLVRKNKQIRQLEGTILQLNAETNSQKAKIEELKEAIVSGTADVDAIKEEIEEQRPTSSNSNYDDMLPPIPDAVDTDQSIAFDDSIALDSDEMNTPAPTDFIQRIMIDGATNTEIEVNPNSQYWHHHAGFLVKWTYFN